MDRKQGEKHSRVELRIAGTQRRILGKVVIVCRNCVIPRFARQDMQSI